MSHRINLKNEFAPDQLITALFAGLINSSILLVIAISFASLMFAGNLEPFLPEGIGIALFTTMTIGLIIALASSYQGTVSSVQDGPLAVLALGTAGIAKSLDGQEAFTTALVLIVLTSFLTGLLFFLIGRYRLGNLFRTVPYPVIGGFLARTGVLILQGGFGIMTNTSFQLLSPQPILNDDILMHWLPGLIVAALILLIQRRNDHFLILPGVIILSLAVFWSVAAASESSISHLQADNWLLGSMPDGQVWKPFFLYDLSHLDSSALLKELPHVPAVLLIATLAMMLNASGLEVATGGDVDLDREVQVAGVANLLMGLTGGMVGFHALGPSVLADKMKARSRLIGLIVSLVFAGVLFLGAELVVYIPRLVLGGMLVYLGLAMAMEWLYDGWFKMSHTDYGIIVLIVVAVASIGYLEGIGIGLLASVVLFTLQYSRLNVIKHEMSGVTYHSTVDRPASHYRQLKESGDSLVIFILEGAIFFGSASTLLQRIQQRINDSTLPDVQFLPLDFRLVKSLDSSVVLNLIRLQQLAVSRNFTLILTHVRDDIRRTLTWNKFNLDETEHFKMFPSLDEGVEWCEEHILEKSQVTRVAFPSNITSVLNVIFPELEHAEELRPYLEKRKFEAGKHLVRQGVASRNFFFLESGEACVQLEHGDTTTRLRKLKAGAVIGEMAYYRQLEHSASVVAETTCVVYVLSATKLQRMEEEKPIVAAAFHRFLASILAERLADMIASYSSAMQ